MSLDEEISERETDFDRMFSNKQIEMLKTAIPFMPHDRQRSLSMIVKLSELFNTIRYFNTGGEKTLSVCADDSFETRLPELLNALRGYCSKAEQDQIDFMFQMIMTIQMMREEL